MFDGGGPVPRQQLPADHLAGVDARAALAGSSAPRAGDPRRGRRRRDAGDRKGPHAALPDDGRAGTRPGTAAGRRPERRVAARRSGRIRPRPRAAMAAGPDGGDLAGRRRVAGAAAARGADPPPARPSPLRTRRGRPASAPAEAVAAPPCRAAAGGTGAPAAPRAPAGPARGQRPAPSPAANAEAAESVRRGVLPSGSREAYPDK